MAGTGSFSAAGSSPGVPSGGCPSPGVGIGRLPIPAIAATSAEEDDELELLELQLLASQPSSRKVMVVPGRFSQRDRNHFSTYPRRRRNQSTLMTLWQERGFLDEIQLLQTRFMFSRLNRLEFNAFTLDRMTNGHNLPTLCTHLFAEGGLLSHYRLDVLDVWKFFDLVERGYHATNPYHNGVHAADVTQAMYCFLQESPIKEHLTPLEFMAAIVAASCHDLDHPGKNEKFLIATSSHLAGMYNNSSVLENHHWRSAIACLWESGLAQALPADDYVVLRDVIKEIILATDISRQQEFLAELKALMESEGIDMARRNKRQFVLQIAMKCADIINPCRSWNISRLWSHRACEEFFRQGDRERELGLNITPFCDRYNITVAKVQAGFYRMVASPLFEEWNRFIASPLTNSMLNNLISNQARWDLIVQQEVRSIMVESAASQTSTSSSSAGGSNSNDSRRESLDPPPSHHRLSRSSAEGDDDSDPCTSYPYLPLDGSDQSTSLAFARRHSLPLSETRSRFTSRTSSEDSSIEDPVFFMGGHSSVAALQRQHSLSERRRMMPQTYASYRLCHKRKLFASSRSPIQTVESESGGSSLEHDLELDPDLSHRVHFHVGPPEVQTDMLGSRQISEEDGMMEQGCNKENRFPAQRRGSAPSSLLISQLTSLTQSSRENSPTATSGKVKPAVSSHSNSSSMSSTGPAAGNSPSLSSSSLSLRRLNFSHRRRGSLPLELVDQPLMVNASNLRSSSCGRSNAEQTKKKKQQRKKILRRRSGGAEMLLPASSSSPQRLNELGGGGGSCGSSSVSSSYSSGSSSSAAAGRRGTHRHHLKFISRRGSAPMGMLLFNNELSTCSSDSSTSIGRSSENSPGNLDLLRELAAISRKGKVQLLRTSALLAESMSASPELLIEDVLIHGQEQVLARRGSLPTDLGIQSTLATMR